jgi:predicted nucleotide-binding protein
VSELQNIVNNPAKTEFNSLSISRGNEDWGYDTLEEFLAQLRSDCSYARLWISNPDLHITMSMWRPSDHTPTDVEVSSKSRELILRLANHIDNLADKCFVAPPPKQPEPPPPKPKIFIGHGASEQWRDLKDHLHDQHGYDIVAYETGSRAGHGIRDVIAEMLHTSAFAILVMTGEDTMADGTVRARQNVIHEIGLFQGRLGFSKAIVLKEEGTEEFSNIHGVQQIRYSKDNIRETLGEVLAVLRREFGERR